MAAGGAQQKIAFPIEVDGEASIEWIWAERLPSGDYRLDNSPFFAYGVSWLDVVSVMEDDHGLRFAGHVAPGGHSTFRVAAGGRDDLDRDHPLWQSILALGCSREIFDDALWAIDAPPTTDLARLVEILEDGERMNAWVWEVGSLRRMD